jgi:hypothetical protein
LVKNYEGTTSTASFKELNSGSLSKEYHLRIGKSMPFNIAPSDSKEMSYDDHMPSFDEN